MAEVVEKLGVNQLYSYGRIVYITITQELFIIG